MVTVISHICVQEQEVCVHTPTLYRLLCNFERRKKKMHARRGKLENEPVATECRSSSCQSYMFLCVLIYLNIVDLSLILLLHGHGAPSLLFLNLTGHHWRPSPLSPLHLPCLHAVLQLKLQQRRTREELVSQGIMPRKSTCCFSIC